MIDEHANRDAHERPQLSDSGGHGLADDRANRDTSSSVDSERCRRRQSSLARRLGVDEQR